jgi:glycosyltransferase 2 family protein
VTKKLAAIAGSAAVLAVTGRIASNGVPRWEQTMGDAINDLPDGLAPYAWPPMQFGSFPAPFLVGALTYWRTRHTDPAVSIAAAGFSAWLAAKGVKRIVRRGRPYDFDPGTSLRLGTEIDGSLGFVSGHAAVAFAIAGIVRPHVGAPLAAAVYGLAALVGLCRIYVGAHLPIDVVGGAALGVMVAEGVAASPLARVGTDQSRADASPGADG